MEDSRVLAADDLDLHTELPVQKPAPLRPIEGQESDFFGGEVNLGMDVENTFDQQDIAVQPSSAKEATATMLESRSSTTNLDEVVADKLVDSASASPSKVIKSSLEPTTGTRSPSGSISGVTNITSAASPTTPSRLHPIPPAVSPEYFKLPTRRMVDPAIFTNIVSDGKIDDAIASFYSGQPSNSRPKRSAITLATALEAPDAFEFLREHGW